MGPWQQGEGSKRENRENTFIFPCKALGCLVLAQCVHSWHAEHSELPGALRRVVRAVQELEGLPLLLFPVRGGNGPGSCLAIYVCCADFQGTSVRSVACIILGVMQSSLL